MKLVIFDIDGTLTDTNSMDSTCAISSIEKVLKLPNGIPSEVIEQMKFETDTSFMMELWEHFKGRYPRTFEINQVKSDLISEFELHKHKYGLEPIEGAPSLFKELREVADVEVGIATGCWKDSAEFKLDAAGIKWRYVPLITAERFRSKLEILKECRDHCKVFYGKRNFDVEVYVGDKDWDEAAAKKLGMKFIRIDKVGNTLPYSLSSYPDEEKFTQLIEAL